MTRLSFLVRLEALASHEGDGVRKENPIESCLWTSRGTSSLRLVSPAIIVRAWRSRPLEKIPDEGEFSLRIDL